MASGDFCVLMVFQAAVLEGLSHLSYTHVPDRQPVTDLSGLAWAFCCPRPQEKSPPKGAPSPPLRGLPLGKLPRAARLSVEKKVLGGGGKPLCLGLDITPVQSGDGLTWYFETGQLLQTELLTLVGGGSDEGWARKRRRQFGKHGKSRFKELLWPWAEREGPGSSTHPSPPQWRPPPAGHGHCSVSGREGASPAELAGHLASQGPQKAVHRKCLSGVTLTNPPGGDQADLLTLASSWAPCPAGLARLQGHRVAQRREDLVQWCDLGNSPPLGSVASVSPSTHTWAFVQQLGFHPAQHRCPHTRADALTCPREEAPGGIMPTSPSH